MKPDLASLLARAGRLVPAAWFGLVLALLGGVAAWRHAEPLAPAQPIAFPHTVHAGRLALPCTFCHAYADRSPQATAPAVSVCMTCHETIATDRPEVRKLRDHAARREPIAWVKVHTLPESAFVRFTHKRHVKAGVACATCHGDVASMERITRVRPLSMGWCVTCHRTRGAPIDCATCHV